MSIRGVHTIMFGEDAEAIRAFLRDVLDLDYVEDSSAETDMNVVMTADGRLVEVQATAERDPFSRELLDDLLDLASGGIEEIMIVQNEAIAAERA